MNYYNENDPKAAAWLRELIKAGLIPAGDVDERSIVDVRPHELTSYTQCHFFAGIGGWPYALKLAGWPEDEPVWTGSCPCQPLSCAGQRKGHADERHLWPAFYSLISECKPPTVFGEQVASKDGREWLAGIRADLEGVGYAIGASDLCAASVGAPHIRQRLYWVAITEGFKLDGAEAGREHPSKIRESGPHSRPPSRRSCSPLWLEHTNGAGKHRRAPSGKQPVCDILHPGDERMGDTEAKRPQEQWSEYRPSGERCSGLAGLAMQAGVPEWNGPTIAVKCQDGRRRVSAQPNSFPLAHGVSARMVKLRGSGNAIVPQVAAEFIQAAIESLNLERTNGR